MTARADPPAIATPIAAGARPAGKVELLLEFEAALRECANAAEIGYLAVNELPRLLRADQAMLLRPAPATGALRLTHVSSLSRIDGRAPLVRALEQRCAGHMAMAEPAPIDLSGLETAAGPFRLTNGLAAPLRVRRGEPAGLLLFAAAHAFQPADLVVAGRVATAIAHALSAFAPRGVAVRMSRRRKAFMLSALGIVLVTSALPFRLSAIAPAEIVPRNADVVAAPLDGVVARILVDPNTPVDAGTPLVRFVDTELVGALAVAERNVEVAAARTRRARQGASLSEDMRRELAVAEAEWRVAGAERDEAAARLDRALVRAPSAGIAVFSRREDWAGRPVATGERIMRIARPGDLAIAIELGLSDAVVLDGEGEVRFFPDANPLAPVRGTIVRAGHVAERAAGERLVFPVDAEPDAAALSGLRIGLRGSAQIYGRRAPLAFHVLRRPLAWLRQRTGM